MNSFLRFVVGAALLSGATVASGCGAATSPGPAPQHQTAIRPATTAPATATTPAGSDPQPARDIRWRRVTDPAGDVSGARTAGTGFDLVSLDTDDTRRLRIRVTTAGRLVPGNVTVVLPNGGHAAAHVQLRKASQSGWSARLTRYGLSNVSGRVSSLTPTTLLVVFPVRVLVRGRASASAFAGGATDTVPDRSVHRHRLRIPSRAAKAASGW